MHEPTQGPDWTIDLSVPPREVHTDPRLSVVAGVIRESQAQLVSIVATMKSVEDVLRDCAALGTTRDEIADQCSLDVAAVDRVLAGGTLINWPR